MSSDDDDNDLFVNHEVAQPKHANAAAVSFVVQDDLTSDNASRLSSASRRSSDSRRGDNDHPTTINPPKGKGRRISVLKEDWDDFGSDRLNGPFSPSGGEDGAAGGPVGEAAPTAKVGGKRGSNVSQSSEKGTKSANRERRRSSNAKKKEGGGKKSSTAGLGGSHQPGFKTMQGFIRGAAQKERIANMRRHEQVSNYEILALRNAFSFPPKCLTAADGGVDEIRGEHIPLVLARLSVECSERLLEALKEECSFYEQDHYDLADLMQIYVSLKRLQYVKLHSSQSWQDNTIIQQALETKNLIIDTHYRTAWNLLMLLLALVQFWVVLFRDGVSGLDRDIHGGYIVVDVICSITTALDILLWTRTAIVNRGRITHIDTDAKIRNKYLRGWAIPDVLSGIPLDTICCLAGASVASGVLSHLRLIRFFRTMSFWRVTGYVSPSKGFILFHFGVLPLVKIVSAILVLLHGSALVFWQIKYASGHVEDLDAVPYVGALYFIVQTYSTVGYGDIRVNGGGELWFTILLVFTALVANGLIIGKLVSLLQLQSAEGVREDRLRETLAVLQFFDIPTSLQSEILNFQDHVLWSKAETTFHSTISQLPSSMVENVDLLRRISIIRSVPFLGCASEALLVSVSRRLQGRSSKPEEYVTCSSDTHQGIRWLLFGYVDQLDPSGRYISTLKGGDYFGLAGLLDREDERYNYKALSYCDLLIFPTEDFHELAHQFPQFGSAAEVFLTQLEDENNTSLNGSLSQGGAGAAGGNGGPPHQSLNISAGVGQSTRIVALRNLHTKLRNFKESLQNSQQGLLGKTPVV